MEERRFQIEDPPPRAAGAPIGDNLLPHVEPPSAGFIIQLFVVPMLIVVMIVAVWLAFNWLVRAASRPEDVVKGLQEGPSVARWQRALELANMLHNEKFADFKRSGESASNLARTLDREIDAAGMKDDEVELRKYLALALGEFEVQEGMDTLLKAATTSRDEREQKVRDGALRAIAVRAYNLQHFKPPQQITNPDVEPTLLRLAGDEDPLIRNQAGYVLGQIGSPAAIERLAVMVDDPDADTRHNAAVALAHRGNAKGVETLAEMLDLDEHKEAMHGKKPPANIVAIRSAIVRTAIDAVVDLEMKNPDANLTPVIDALKTLSKADKAALAEAYLAPDIPFDARQALEKLCSEEPAEEAPVTDKPKT